MKRFFAIIFIIGIVFIPKYGCCQGVWDAWDRSASSVNHTAIEKAVRDALNSANKQTSSEGKEDRKEAERRGCLRNASNVLSYIDNTEYRSMILYESEFRERLKSELSYSRYILDYFKNDDGIRQLVMSDPSLQKKIKDKIWEQKGRMLDFASNPYLLELIISDRLLKQQYESLKMQEDVRMHPEHVINYINDPKFKQEIINNPELMQGISRQILDEVQNRIVRDQRRIEREREEQIRQLQEEQAERNRIKEERERAVQQQAQNDKEFQENNQIKDEFLSSSMFAQVSNTFSMPQINQESKLMFGINYQDDLTEDEYFDELLGTDSPTNTKVSNKPIQNTEVKEMSAGTDGDSYIKAKLDCAIYDSKEKLAKGWETSKRKITTIVKETPEKTKKRVVSIPVNKVKAETNRILDKIYPGYEMGKRVEVISKFGKEEKGFVQEIIQCISKEAVDAVTTGNTRQFEECVNRSKDAFVGQMHSHIETLSGVKYRRYMPWLTKKGETDENDE